ncbi:histidine--tRNA ligase-like [Schistocerca gregaria]|uniref:histidine--tRNA ligase-like n=1 Tax=Schistocerca gregaria TaxID=7010 RepID=UPI00211F2956|nr:histidine--tRNA ligase-like [Schistocerca gregaria]XP_049851292.1 histidine--tRNA ligase-like [Schistocerca gregaria]
MKRGICRLVISGGFASRTWVGRRAYATSALKPVRGMHDVVGLEMQKRDHVLRIANALAASYGFQPISTPIVELEAVFARTLGEDSDVISKEMYTFEDRTGNKLVLRPEFTASVARCLINKHYSIPKKVFYFGPAFRYERPQKGRRRQFHQFGIEQFGTEHFLSDVHAMEMAVLLVEKLRIENTMLEVNSLGDKETRMSYRRALEIYFSKYDKVLSSTSVERLRRGSVLRILDSKEEEDQVLVANAPEVTDYMTKASKERLDRVLEGLTAIGVRYRLNPRLVRGLDYYNDTCFELVDSSSGLALIAGGRYDALVKQMGGRPTPGVGWAAGIERLIDCVSDSLLKVARRPIGVVAVSEASEEVLDLIRRKSLSLAQELRKLGVPVVVDCMKSVAKQFRAASKESCKWVIVVGAREVEREVILLKDMDSGEERLTEFENVMALVRDQNAASKNF